MIDTHCHLLPALDDGPATVDASLALADVLWQQGVRTVVCTPHVSRRFPTRHVDAESAARALRARLRERGPALELLVAAEVADAVAVSATLAELQQWSIAGRYLLVEVLPTSPSAFFTTVRTRLAAAGIEPILAHPERSRAVQRDPSVLDEARARGALVQVVAPSLVGRWGDAIRATAWSLLESGRVDLVASDAHGTKRRRCHLERAAGLVAERLGGRAAAELTERRPRAVLGEQAVPQEGRWS